MFGASSLSYVHSCIVKAHSDDTQKFRNHHASNIGGPDTSSIVP